MGKLFYPLFTHAECSRLYAANKERARYQKIKNTPDFKAVRAAYLKRLAERCETEPGFYMATQARHLLALRNYRGRVNNDPGKIGAYKAAARQRARDFRAELRKSPTRHAEFIKQQRLLWYDSLSDDDYLRIFGRVRRYKKKRLPR